MGEIHKTPRAEEDLLEIWLYIALDDMAAADRLYDLVETKFRALADFPHIGQQRPELAHDLLSFPVGRYVIFYKPIERGIEVVRVLHAARDVRRQF